MYEFTRYTRGFRQTMQQLFWERAHDTMFAGVLSRDGQLKHKFIDILSGLVTNSLALSNSLESGFSTGNCFELLNVL
jgi:hypothetical protein